MRPAARLAALAAVALAAVAFGGSTVLAASAADGDGGGTPPTVTRANPSDIVYCPPERLAEGPAYSQQRLNVFLPVGTPPPAGWPVVVTTPYGGGEATLPRTQLTETGPSFRLWEFLDAGLAVVDFGTTAVGGGDGLFYPPGHPSGRDESFLPADDNPEKEARWAIQWIKSQIEYPFDLERVGTWGRSGGAVILMRAAMGPDGARSSGSPQIRASTRVRAIAALQPPASVWAFDQGPIGISLPEHLERADQPGVPADELSQVAEELQKDYSLMRACFAEPAERWHNAAQAICLVFGDPMAMVDGEPADLSLDATGFPVLHDLLAPPFQHDQWSGQVLWRRLVGLSPDAAAFHAERSIFAVRDVYALPPPDDVQTHTFSGTFLGAQATALVRTWLVGELCPPDPGLADAGFEEQAEDAPPAAPWAPFAGTAHRVLGLGGGADQGFPGQGARWLELSAAGSSAALPPSDPGGATQPAVGGLGVSQVLTLPAGLPVLSFRAAFLRGGPAASPARNDWASVDVDDGTTTHNVYFRDTFSPTPLVSTRTGLAMTRRETVAVDLRQRFPGLAPGSPLTLTLQVGNGGDGADPSRLYVDDLRFRPSGAEVLPLGCPGTNPPESLAVRSGIPALGTTVTFGLADPTGTLAPGSATRLFVADTRHPHACGFRLGNFGLGGRGYWLLGSGPTASLGVNGAPWPGAGRVGEASLALPSNAALVGLSFYAQGVLIDRSSPGLLRLGVTEARELHVGP